jgi:hypothetical protein
VVMRRLHGRLIRHKVGTYPAITLAAAREAARDANLAFERVIDPRAKQKASALQEQRRRESTVKAVAADFAALHLSKLRSGAETKASIEREFVSRWGDRPIGEVSDEDIVRLLNELTRSGRPAAASKMLGHARKLFGWAAAQKIYGLKRSPVADLSASELLGKKVERDRSFPRQSCASYGLSHQGRLSSIRRVRSCGFFLRPASAYVRFPMQGGMRSKSRMRFGRFQLHGTKPAVPTRCRCHL